MQTYPSTPSASLNQVTLRAAQPSDVPLLFAFESDPAWCAMAMVKPRSAEVFRATWEKIFQDWAAGLMEVVQRTILVDGDVCGTIGRRLLGGQWTVGYGLGRAYWGRGIASRALGLLLAESALRPLYATVAATNAASICVLQKHGFAITQTRKADETERCLPREEVIFVLS